MLLIHVIKVSEYLSLFFYCQFLKAIILKDFNKIVLAFCQLKVRQIYFM